MSNEFVALSDPLKVVLLKTTSRPGDGSAIVAGEAGHGPRRKFGRPAFPEVCICPVILENATKLRGSSCAARTILRRIPSLRASAVARFTLSYRGSILSTRAHPGSTSQI